MERPERTGSLGASRRAKVKPTDGLSATGRGRKVDEEGMSERRLAKPKPPGGRMTRREEREKPHHVTRTGFFAQREAGFQVGFVAPTGTSIPVTATKKPREILRSAAMAVKTSNLLKTASVWGQPKADADDAQDDPGLGVPSALVSADHRLLESMSGTRFFETGERHQDVEDERPQGEKEHHVRAAQALWSTNDGMALSLQEFADVADHQERLAALHVVAPHSDSEEELDAVDKQRSRSRPTSVGRLSRVNMPEQLPVEMFLDEYPKEIIDYLRSRWGTKHLREKQRRKLQMIRTGLRRSLGPSKQLRRVMWSCCVSATAVLAIVIYLGVLLHQLNSELFELQNTAAVGDPHNVNLKLSVARHDISLTQDGTSRVCKCFSPSQLTDRQRLVRIKPEVVSTSHREVVASVGVYVTSCTTEECLGGENFDCADHYGGTESKLLMRWNSLQHMDSSGAISLPPDVGLRVIPRIARPRLYGEATNLGKYRLMLVVEYNLQRMPHLMQPAVWNARKPWSAVGLQVFMRDVNSLDHSADVLTLAAVGFELPAAVPDTRIAFNVSLGARLPTGTVLDYSPWVSPEGYSNGLTLFGGQYTTRELGRSVAVRLIRNESDPRNAIQVSSTAFATRAHDYGQSLRVLASDEAFPHLGGGDVVEVECRFDSVAKLSPTTSAWVSEAGSANPESSGTLSEICVAQLYYYPDLALEFPHRTLHPGECTTSEVLEEYVG
jgi:hypothetical protein